MKPIEDAIADALPLKRSSVDSIRALLTENFGVGTLYGGMSESERQTRKALAVLHEADRVDDPQMSSSSRFSHSREPR